MQPLWPAHGGALLRASWRLSRVSLQRRPGRHERPRCQEVRALGTDAAFERVLLDALAPDQIAMAVAAIGQIEAKTQALEHQWGLKRERDHGKDSCAILTHRRRAAESPRQAIAVLSGAVH